MSELTTIQQPIERRTYIKGKFRGKFIGYLDQGKSDVVHENFYDLEVLSGEIKTSSDKAHIRHWETGEPEEFVPVEKFLSKLPESIGMEVDYGNGRLKHYEIKLHEPKLSRYVLTSQVYEKERVFGDITGEISGYILHYDLQDVQVEVVHDKSGEVPITPESMVFKTESRTGETETNGNYKRWEYYYSNGSTYWGAWQKQGSDSSFSALGFIGGLFQLLVALLILIPIVINGWMVILPLLIAWGLFYVLSLLPSFLSFIWRWFLRLCLFAFICTFIYGIASIFRERRQTNTQRRNVYDLPEEVSSSRLDSTASDSVISHFRIWEDYDTREYSGYLSVLRSELTESTLHRNSISLDLSSTDRYNELVSVLHVFDMSKLLLIYEMFDSLRVAHNLDETRFAEVIASCIQDIPYTLVLESDCDIALYQDDFIRSYLRNGGPCQGFIKYGILSPTEFMGYLIGDCDTRTLLLFTILNHYKYDVAMLGSEIYRHSVIGINLPFPGLAKIINGKRYVIWETTEQGIPPGVLPMEQSDTRYWRVNIISNNNPSI
jgi:hypothetical protein